ncbi:MAG TPA: hypothetical protein VFN10_14790 [Thermoanaerobaculia bacterium]|nr:hypothetical protein [Thermoanaerobaculia bacterium]
MPDHIHYDDADLFNPETKHEETDVPIKPLFWGIVIFIIVGVLTHFIVLFLYKGFAKAERRQDGPIMTEVARPADMNVPRNQPLLQPFPRKMNEQGEVLPPYSSTPVTDLDAMVRTQNASLHNYGWVDKQKGVVHIPIDVAIDLVAQRGLPTAAAPAPVLTPVAEPNAPAGAPGGH